jgi:phosphoglycerate dehydrogenase-like enzyme
VARVCQAMGMDVIAFTARPRLTAESRIDCGFIVHGTGDPNGTIPSAWYSGLDKKSLHNFLEQDVDLLVISLPLTNDTAQLLGEEEFTILGRKRNAFVSNVSRGGIIDHNALVAAVKKSPKDGGLRGAALDVTDPEPLPKESELWELPNVFITPHVSGRSLAYNQRVFQILDTNLTRLERNDRLINVIERDRRGAGFLNYPVMDYSKQ